MRKPSPTDARKPRRVTLGSWLGYLFALAGLAWVLYDIHPLEALRDFSRVDWRWAAFAVVCDISSYAAHGLRWKLLLVPLGRVRLRDSLRAVYSGLFANEILPLRSGEVLRAYLVSRAAGIRMPEVLTSVGVERLIDGAVLVAAIAIVSMYVPLGGHLQHAAEWLGALVLALLLLGALILFLFGRKSARLAGPPPGKLAWHGRVLEGLRQISLSPSLYASVAASVLTPLTQAWAMWAMLRAYGLPLPFLSAAAVLFLINLGVALPNAPGNVGAYQFFCVLGLTLFGVEKTRAAGFSIFVFVVFTLALLLIGFAALTQSGLSVASIRREVARLLGERRAPSVSGN
jgi:uncharacterized membrane protein YbhN (UPF0104 family)